MKEIKKQIQRTETIIRYEAVDGTIFPNREECERYESTALGVLMGKLMKLVETKTNEWDLLKGEEYTEVLAIRMPREQDKDTVLQTYYLRNPWVFIEDENAKKNKEGAEALVDQAYRDNDLLLIGMNTDNDSFFMLDTRMNIINRLNNLDKKDIDKEIDNTLNEMK